MMGCTVTTRCPGVGVAVGTGVVVGDAVAVAAAGALVRPQPKRASTAIMKSAGLMKRARDSAMPLTPLRRARCCPPRSGRWMLERRWEQRNTSKKKSP